MDYELVGFLGLLFAGFVDSFNVIYGSLLLAGDLPVAELTGSTAFFLAVACLSLFLLAFHFLALMDTRKRSRWPLYSLIFLWSVAVIVTIAMFAKSYAKRADWAVSDWDEIVEITDYLNSRDLSSLLSPRKGSSGGGKGGSRGSRGSGRIMRDRNLVKLARSPGSGIGCIVGAVLMLTASSGMLAAHMMEHRQEEHEDAKDITDTYE